ncbi:DUF1295 domain-containing protein [Fictibacillus fluitans]|uniref:DUF1295 domain-containing protein n=1 Tax=Fictibacillus fluitans TaxID=3058422 RepID=A0ABT8I034_9BACL|nr:DUF1295 domain-containing protein [Fictibacillus sp. NE201]MDN4526324.1 DUF1295 domain-containing protein [Fictibacillus sp. NE201]
MNKLYDHQLHSLYPRLVLMGLETLILIAACWLLLYNGPAIMNSWLNWNLPHGDERRNGLMLFLIVLTYIRMIFTIFYFLKRPLPWEEAFTVPFAFAIYYLLIPLLSLFTNKPLNAWDISFVLIFFLGSFINTYSEWLRDRWKKNPSNHGKLYTGGLFRYSMHVNYFGDCLWVLALAMLTWNLWALFIPAALFILFTFYNIPMLDQHLEEKYGTAFLQYRKSTSKLVPFLY